MPVCHPKPYTPKPKPYPLGACRTSSQGISNVLGALLVAAIFLGTNNASTVQPVVDTERTVFFRERSAGCYAPYPFALAQILVEVPYLLVQTIMYSCITCGPLCSGTGVLHACQEAACSAGCVRAPCCRYRAGSDRAWRVEQPVCAVCGTLAGHRLQAGLQGPGCLLVSILVEPCRRHTSIFWCASCSAL